jgi:hypothetical protein
MYSSRSCLHETTNLLDLMLSSIAPRIAAQRQASGRHVPSLLNFSQLACPCLKIRCWARSTARSYRTPNRTGQNLGVRRPLRSSAARLQSMCRTFLQDFPYSCNVLNGFNLVKLDKLTSRRMSSRTLKQILVNRNLLRNGIRLLGTILL